MYVCTLSTYVCTYMYVCTLSTYVWLFILWRDTSSLLLESMLWSLISAIFADFGRKIGGVLKNQCYDPIFEQFVLSQVPICPQFFSAKIFLEIITSVPGCNRQPNYPKIQCFCKLFFFKRFHLRKVKKILINLPRCLNIDIILSKQPMAPTTSSTLGNCGTRRSAPETGSQKNSDPELAKPDVS
jgi:hypothetical protein